jgi:signal peptidase I
MISAVGTGGLRRTLPIAKGSGGNVGSAYHFQGRRRLSVPGIVATAILLALGLRLFVVDLVIISGDSMEPAVRTGSVVLVLRCAYGLRRPFGGGYFIRWRDPFPGEVVLVEPAAGQDGRRRVKRVFETGPAFLNTVAQVLYGRAGEIPLSPADAVRHAGASYLQPGFVFLVGDNLSASYDSRHQGPVPIEMIGGMVLLYH